MTGANLPQGDLPQGVKITPKCGGIIKPALKSHVMWREQIGGSSGRERDQTRVFGTCLARDNGTKLTRLTRD